MSKETNFIIRHLSAVRVAGFLFDIYPPFLWRIRYLSTVPVADSFLKQLDPSIPWTLHISIQAGLIELVLYFFEMIYRTPLNKEYRVDLLGVSRKRLFRFHDT
jgi:hypothetical protein